MALQIDTKNRHDRAFPKGYVVIEKNTYRRVGTRPQDRDVTAIAAVYPDREEWYRGHRPMWRMWFTFKYVPDHSQGVEGQAHAALMKEDRMKGAIEVD